MDFRLFITLLIILIFSVNFSLGSDKIGSINEFLERVKSGENLSKVYEEYTEKSKGEYILEYQKDTGFLKKGTIDKDIEKIVFNLKIGEISDIIESKDGYHIFKVIDKKENLIRLEFVSFVRLMWKDKDKNEEIEVTKEAVPEIKEASPTNLIQPEKVYISPYKEKDKIFISSVPVNGEVYIESFDSKNPLFDFNNFRGITPLSVKLEEGEYIIGIEIPAERFDISIDKPVSADIPLLSYIMTTSPENETNQFEWDNEISLRITVKNEKLVKLAKIYKVKKIKDKKAILISLFQPKDPYVLPYDSIEKLFDFDEDKLYILLIKENIPEVRIRDIIERVHRFGKIILRDCNKKLLINISQDGNFSIIKR